MKRVSIFKKTCRVLIFFFLAAHLPAWGYAGEAGGDHFYIEAKGEGIRFNRSRDFKIANTGDWAALAMLGGDGQGKEDPLSFDQDRWGGGYEIAAIVPGEKVACEVLFGQSFSGSLQKKNGLHGVSARVYTSMAFIDAAPHGGDNTYGYFLSDAAPAFTRATSRVELDYDASYYEIAVRGVYHAVKKNRFQLDLVGGPAYQRSFQNYRFRTWGTNAQIGGETFSETEEKLTDHLFGGALGLRGRANLYKRIFVSVEQMLGGFLKYSRLTARQDIHHASGFTGIVPWMTDLNECITLRDHSVGFVPQVSSRFELEYEVTRRTLLSFFYQYDLWLNMSRIQNPVVAADLRSVHNGAAQIRDDETLSSHTIGGKLTVRF